MNFLKQLIRMLNYEMMGGKEKKELEILNFQNWRELCTSMTPFRYGAGVQIM